MTERPILFSGPMVRAILEGRKTQTRRVVKPQPVVAPTPDDRCPYGEPGTTLWVRETWASTEQAGFHPSDAGIVYRATDPDWSDYEGWKWKPSIFMPRWASRITLEVTAVRVELAQEISVNDCLAEGIVGTEQWDKVPPDSVRDHCELPMTPEALDAAIEKGWGDYTTAAFHDLWDSINKKRGFGWAENPWVWVVEFRRITDA